MDRYIYIYYIYIVTEIDFNLSSFADDSTMFGFASMHDRVPIGRKWTFFKWAPA
jgi:hypothetical protein